MICTSSSSSLLGVLAAMACRALKATLAIIFSITGCANMRARTASTAPRRAFGIAAMGNIVPPFTCLVRPCVRFRPAPQTYPGLSQFLLTRHQRQPHARDMLLRLTEAGVEDHGDMIGTGLHRHRIAACAVLDDEQSLRSRGRLKVNVRGMGWGDKGLTGHLSEEGLGDGAAHCVQVAVRVFVVQAGECLVVVGALAEHQRELVRVRHVGGWCANGGA